MLATALGNPNHMALAELARHAGHEAGALRVRAFDSTPDAVAAVVDGTADLGAVSAASVVRALEDGTLRVLGLTAPARLPGPLAAVPTWVEQGVDCTIGAWRGISGSPGTPPRTAEFWREAMATAAGTLAWHKALLRQSWAPMLLTSDALERMPALRMISQTGRNVGHIDLAACAARGITISAGGAGGPHATAELCWGLILSALRHIPEEVQRLQAGAWQHTLGTGLKGRVLGI